MKYDIPFILDKKFSDRKFVIFGDEYEGLKILDDLGPITIEDLEKADLELQALEYKDLRKQEYPTLDQMLVAIIEKEEGRPEALEELMAARLEIKNKYPKPL